MSIIFVRNKYYIRDTLSKILDWVRSLSFRMTFFFTQNRSTFEIKLDKPTFDVITKKKRNYWKY